MSDFKSKGCWIPRDMRRKNKSPKSQTPGKSKDWNCKRDPDSPYMAKRNRSHKHEGYASWSARHRGEKSRGKTKEGVVPGYRIGKGAGLLP